MKEEYRPETVVTGLCTRNEESRKDPGDSDYREMVINTRLIQQSLDDFSESGGGTVVVPPGTYWIRTICIPSCTELRLMTGCRLVAWYNAEDYEPFSSGISLIVSSEAEKIALTGGGTIDGNGFAFWDIPLREYKNRGGKRGDLQLKPHWEDDSPFWRAKDKRISPLIELKNCRDVVIRDIAICDSPGWTLHPFCCDRVIINGITITNHMYGPNTDGIDINGCRDVTVRDCFISCGDDAVIVKATAKARSCERICVSGCVLETHCAAFGIGAEVVFPIRDITVTGITVKRALRMIQIEVWDSSLVENVLISNVAGVNMTDIPLERPVYIDIQHHGRSDGSLGAVRNVQITGLSAVTRGRCVFTAADGSTIERLNLFGMQLVYPEIEDPELSVTSSRSNQMSNDNPHTRAGRSAFIFDNVKDANIRDIQIQWPDANAADRAAIARGSYDWGELSSDRRKQEALAADTPMHAFMFRGSSRIAIDAPFVEGYKASLYQAAGENGRILLNGKDIGG